MPRLIALVFAVLFCSPVLARAACGTNLEDSVLTCPKLASGVLANVDEEKVRTLEIQVLRMNDEIFYKKNLPGKLDTIRYRNTVGNFSIEVGLFHADHPEMTAAIDEVEKRLATKGFRVELTPAEAVVWIEPRVAMRSSSRSRELFTYFHCASDPQWGKWCSTAYEAAEAKTKIHERLLGLKDALKSSTDPDFWIKSLNELDPTNEQILPENAVLLRKGGVVEFTIHYTWNAKQQGRPLDTLALPGFRVMKTLPTPEE